LPVDDSGNADSATADVATCIWVAEAGFSSGTVGWDGCASAAAEASFEFSASAVPEAAEVELHFIASDDCEVSLRLPSLCGLGTYTVEGGRAAVAVVTNGCTGVPAEEQGTFVAARGNITLSGLGAGTATGDLSGLHLPLYVQGSYDIFAEGNVRFVADVQASVEVSAANAGTNGCDPPA
jgi:hypothetical protein